MTDSRLSVRNEWFRVWMPYQFIRLDVADSKHVYLPLNRNYKPLGHGTPRQTQPWVDYKDFLDQAVVFCSDPHLFTGVWEDAERLYLYNDAKITQSSYFERLHRLMDRKVRLYGAIEDDG